MLNVVVLQGRLVKDTELKTTNSGKSVISFPIAVQWSYSGGKSENPPADFIDCVAWNKTAEFINQYFHKGDMILLNGSLKTRKFEGKNGEKRKATEVIVTSVNFAGTKKETEAGGHKETYATAQSNNEEFHDLPTEELPF